jgi:uncharacterized protein (DUF433 family)
MDTITVEPGKRGVKPCIRGLRITVYDILEYLACGMTVTEILADFPDLTCEDTKVCLVLTSENKRRTVSVQRAWICFSIRICPRLSPRRCRTSFPGRFR